MHQNSSYIKYLTKVGSLLSYVTVLFLHGLVASGQLQKWNSIFGQGGNHVGMMSVDR